MATIIHRTTNRGKYKSSKVAYVVAFIEILLTKDLFTNFSQFRFRHYKKGNITPHLELL